MVLSDKNPFEEQFIFWNKYSNVAKCFLKHGGWNSRERIKNSGYKYADFKDIPLTKINEYTWVQIDANGKWFGIYRTIRHDNIKEFFVNEPLTGSQ